MRQPLLIDIHVAAALELWLAALSEEQQASEYTVRGYSQDLRAFLDYLTERSANGVSLSHLAALELEQFNDYCAHLDTAGKAPSSVARAVSALRNFFRFLAERQLANNPFIKQLPAPRVPRRVIKSLSQTEAGQVIQIVAELSDAPWIAKRDEALFALLYGSGLRLGEALALTRGQAPAGTRLLVGNGNRRRSVPLAPFVPALVADYLRACPYSLSDDQPLFVGARGKRLNPGVVQRQIRRLRVLLQLPNDVTAHTFRQCFAQRLREEGGDLRAIQKILGHAYPATTQRYCNPS
ncbi:MAG: tyrosine-type recombinase/integrase [Candidatus Competibacteraceae bacterium]|jgi:integrase/recombinase XerC|nr:tyrosine-type recombinase/integrase [Candidatus Competibacteraceae bacterium]